MQRLMHHFFFKIIIPIALILPHEMSYQAKHEQTGIRLVLLLALKNRKRKDSRKKMLLPICQSLKTTKTKNIRNG